MVILNFEKHRLKRQEEQDYREQLIKQILLHHENSPESERADSFYFDYIREHFSIEMLEDNLRRLRQKACNS